MVLFYASSEDREKLHQLGAELGVATYDNIEIKEIQTYLPTTEQIQERLAVAEQEFLMNVRQE